MIASVAGQDGRPSYNKREMRTPPPDPTAIRAHIAQAASDVLEIDDGRRKRTKRQQRTNANAEKLRLACRKGKRRARVVRCYVRQLLPRVKTLSGEGAEAKRFRRLGARSHSWWRWQPVWLPFRGRIRQDICAQFMTERQNRIQIRVTTNLRVHVSRNPKRINPCT